MGFLIPPHPLANFEIEKYYENEPDLMVFILETICLKKIKDGPYEINLDEYAGLGTHWITLFCNKSAIVYFNSFGAEHIFEEIKEIAGNKNVIANIAQV